MGVRAALTGDLTAISPDALSTGGYPPRPDPTGTPDYYAEWVQKVTRPFDIYSGAGIARIGYSGTGAFQGRGPSNPWNGFVQTASGFASSNPVVASSGTYYQEYEAEIFVPPGLTCNGNCNTWLWAGIGGCPSLYFTSILSGQGLIQSGLNLVGSGTSNILLAWEYWPGWPIQAINPPGGIAFGDEFETWGWSASDTNCTHSTNGAYACFALEDNTQGWYFQPAQALNINGAGWFPSTVEYVAEELSWSNAQYYWSRMRNGLAWDFNGNIHADPSSGTDPYVIATTTGSSGSILTVAEWNNASFDNPASPMWFVWNAAN